MNEKAFNIHNESKEKFILRFEKELKEKASSVSKDLVYIIKLDGVKMVLGLFDKTNKIWDMKFDDDGHHTLKTIYFISDAKTPEEVQLQMMFDLPKIGLDYKRVKITHGRFSNDKDKFCTVPAQLNGHKFQAILKIDRFLYYLDGGPDRLNAIYETTEPYILEKKEK